MSRCAVVVTCRRSGRTGAISGHAETRLSQECVEVRRVDLSRLDLNSLASTSCRRGPAAAGASDLAVRASLTALEGAEIVVLVTPVHQGSYAGMLKLYLDALPRDGLRGRTVVVLGSAGTTRHALALESILPVVSAMGAEDIARPCCLTPEDWFVNAEVPRLRPAAVARLDERLRLHRRSDPEAVPSRLEMAGEAR